MELPTSSNDSPTPSNSAPTAEVKPQEYKEKDGLYVDKKSKQIYLMTASVPAQHFTALKCPNCQMVTSHSMTEITMYTTDPKFNDTNFKQKRRVIGCQNCGKISTK